MKGEKCLTIFWHFSHSHDHNGHPNSWRQHPDEHVDHLSFGGSTKLQCPDRVAHSDVAVHAHHSESEDACEHVVIIDGYNELAQDLPKRPCVHEVFSALERQRAGCQGVSKSQIEDVDVCGRLHLGVSGCDHRAEKRVCSEQCDNESSLCCVILALGCEILCTVCFYGLDV